jgi:hypothetical protein
LQEKKILASDDSDNMKWAKIFGLRTFAAVGGGIESVKSTIRGIPGQISEPFSKAYDSAKDVYYEYNATSYEDRYYNSSYYRSVQGKVLSGSDPVSAKWEVTKEDLLNQATLGIKPIVENAVTNGLDYSEGRIDPYTYNIRQGKAAGEAIQLYAMMRGGRAISEGAGASKPMTFKEGLQNLRSEVSSLKSSVSKHASSFKESASKIFSREKPEFKASKISHSNIQSELDPYIVRQVGNEIAENPVASKSYSQMQKFGTEVELNFGRPPGVDGVFEYGAYSNKATVYMQRNVTAKEAVSTLCHESCHARTTMLGRSFKGTQFDEFRAFTREVLYNTGKRPSLEKRLEIWENIQKNYPDRPMGKNPFTGERK